MKSIACTSKDISFLEGIKLLTSSQRWAGNEFSIFCTLGARQTIFASTVDDECLLESPLHACNFLGHHLSLNLRNRELVIHGNGESRYVIACYGPLDFNLTGDSPTFPFLGFYSWDVTARHKNLWIQGIVCKL